MLADYPVVVDYNFSPVQSPLFHRDFGPEDEFFTPSHCDVDDIELPLTDSAKFNHHFPLIDDDDVSSLSASIQYSETIDVDFDVGCDDTHNDAVTEEEAPGCCSNTTPVQHHLQDCSIPGRGVVDVEGLFGSVGSDYLNSCSYLSALQETSLPENVPLDILNPAELELCLGSNVEMGDCSSQGSKVTDKKSSSSLNASFSPSSSRPKGKRKKKTEDKRWSEMDSYEREEVAEHLSTVLQSLLGPRERMEVFAMLSQQKTSRLSDRDFVIESHMLNESTLAKLETYLEQHEVKGEASDSELISEPERKRNCGNAGRRKCASLPASPQHRGSYSESSPSIGVKKRSGQRKSLRSLRRRTRKEYRQESKERRSGLFQQEEVISLTGNTEEDDVEAEIDILD